MPNPTISIIIPTYNRKNIVADAINSVLAQTFKGYEIIVVDDGSTDGTAEYLHEHLKSSDKALPIKLIVKENGGVSSARNAGIKSALGKYVAFLDSDDLWLPEKLEHQLSYFQKHPDISIVYTDEYLEINGQIEPKTRFQRANLSDNEKNNFLLPGFVQHTPIHTSTVMIEKTVFDEVGYFNETLKIHEDTELWNRISRKYTFGYIDTPLAMFRYTEGAEHLMKDYKSESSKEEGKKYLKLYEEMHKDDMTDEIRGAVSRSWDILESF